MDFSKKSTVAGNPLLMGIGAYLLWGLLPLYWKLGSETPPIAVAAHRVFWSFVLLSAYLLAKQGRQVVAGLITRFLAQPLVFLVSALSIGCNWSVYIWAISKGYLLASGLGYLLSPLLYVVVGVLFLNETLRPVQKIASFLGCISVLPMVYAGDLLSVVIAICLAVCIVIYGLCKKFSPIAQIEALWIDLFLLCFFAGPFLLFMPAAESSVDSFAWGHTLWLVGSGIATLAPLLMFTVALESLPLSTIGFLQYINPSLQLVLASVVFGEVVDSARAWSFAIAWLAVAVLLGEGVKRSLARRRSLVVERGTS